jgi:hypothetical protein
VAVESLAADQFMAADGATIWAHFGDGHTKLLGLGAIPSLANRWCEEHRPALSANVSDDGIDASPGDLK